MTVENIIEYSSMAGAATLFAIKSRELKRYLPAALLAFFLGVSLSEFAEYFHWWTYPSRAVFYFDTVSATASFVVVPVLAMLSIRYSPSGLPGLLLWGLLNAGVFTGFEYLLERYTKLMEYGAGYNWYYSFILWYASWAVWYSLHRWFYKGIPKP